MNAPDKIYIDDNVFPTHINWDGSPINTKRIESSDIEYVRKDALLEWVKNKKARLKQGYKHDWKNDDIIHGGTLILDSLIDKIESL